MNDNLLSQFNALEAQLLELFNTLCVEFAQASYDEQVPLKEHLVTVISLIHNVRETLRQAAPELYRNF